MSLTCRTDRRNSINSGSSYSLAARALRPRGFNCEERSSAPFYCSVVFQLNPLLRALGKRAELDQEKQPELKSKPKPIYRLRSGKIANIKELLELFSPINIKSGASLEAPLGTGKEPSS